MIGMCNTLVHEYDDVDLHIVWETGQKDLLGLIAIIEPLVPSDEQ